MKNQIALNPNKLVQHLQKPSEDFTKQDIVKFVEDNGIRMINFRYVGGDGRLKTLNFVIQSKAHLDQILSMGERVDGSSLFAYIPSSESDLYVIPRYKTAFVNPFTKIPTIDIMCSYYTIDGAQTSRPAISFLAVSLRPSSFTITFLSSLTRRMCTCSPLPACPTMILGAKLTSRSYL